MYDDDHDDDGPTPAEQARHDQAVQQAVEAAALAMFTLASPAARFHAIAYAGIDEDRRFDGHAMLDALEQPRHLLRDKPAEIFYSTSEVFPDDPDRISGDIHLGRLLVEAALVMLATASPGARAEAILRAGARRPDLATATDPGLVLRATTMQLRHADQTEREFVYLDPDAMRALQAMRAPASPVQPVGDRSEGQAGLADPDHRTGDPGEQ